MLKFNFEHHRKALQLEQLWFTVTVACTLALNDAWVPQRSPWRSAFKAGRSLVSLLRPGLSLMLQYACIAVHTEINAFQKVNPLTMSCKTISLCKILCSEE